ncbi:protein Asterix isoform X2 [Phyllopteryx taeniolatus]|uniref:protein Asterix isoform X2 n=1 Tax=Phyllopteryx taeniolatus TaxID=161469 RepID=UPI002AD38585|nr:protein Asterix isoform X2 [Phyllopteryx taeniolatus]
MSSNNMSDPRRQNKILRYKPPTTETNPTLEDPTPDYMNLLGMIFSMCGLMLKLKWCAWIAVYCSFISFANSRSSEDTKQMMSSFIRAERNGGTAGLQQGKLKASNLDILPGNKHKNHEDTPTIVTSLDDCNWRGSVTNVEK